MKLTDKTKEDFWTWYLLPENLKKHKLSGMFRFSNENVIKVNFLALAETCQNAFIIEFFQYQQIWERIFYVEYRKTAFMNSFHATNEAIIKANEMYNQK